tara:strand:- start:952 stop:1176 length:225 start_codon:yes stop_codon:yes gene_type:complete
MGERKLVKERTTRAYTGTRPSEKQWEKVETGMDDFAAAARRRALARRAESEAKKGYARGGRVSCRGSFGKRKRG